MASASYAALDERGVLAVTGADARDFLQGMISNDIAKAGPNRAIYAALLTPQGKYLFDFFVVEADGALLLDGEAARLGELIRRFALYRLRARVEFVERSAEFRVAAIWGAGARGVLGLPEPLGAALPWDGGLVYVDPRLAAAGARAIVERREGFARLEAAGIEAAPRTAYERHRLALGLPDASRDLEIEKATLMESGFEELHGVDFEKGCYVGQELTARMHYRGLGRRRLFKVAVDGPLPAPGTPILADGREAGRMRSGLDDRGLALLRLDRVEEARAKGVLLTAEGATLTPITPDWAAIPGARKPTA